MSLSLIPGLALITDQNGNYVASTCGQVPPTTNAAGATTSTYAGILSAGLNPQGIVTPFQLDATGANVSRALQYPTMSFCPINPVATGATAGKSMLSLFNASGSGLYQRVVGFYAMAPPQLLITGGGLANASTTYTLITFAAFKITGHSGGSNVVGVGHDARDTYDTTNFTVRAGATLAGQGSLSLNTFDAGYNATINWAQRQDDGAKLYTMAPGEGLAFVCQTASGNATVNFLLRAVTVQSAM